MKPLTRKRSAFVARLAFGIMLVLSGIGKAFDSQPVMLLSAVLAPDASTTIMGAVRIVEDSAWAIEIVVGASLLFAVGVLLRGSLCVALGAAIVAVEIHLPSGVQCRCFGIIGSVGSTAGVIIGISLVLYGVFVVGDGLRSLKILRHGGRLQLR